MRFMKTQSHENSRKQMADTPILILTPYFAPQTHAAMFRVHKLVKYLPEHGFRPLVVTTDINYLYNEDPQLLAELPDSVEVIRARYIEPTARGIRMALGGADRTFAALKSRYQASAVASGPPRQTGAGSSARLPAGWASALVRTFAEWPDRHWTWTLAAEQACCRLIEQHNIRLLYTTANPFSPLRLALKLQKRYGLRWVADFRDPAGYGQKHTARGMVAQAMEHDLLSRTMAKADRVTGLAESYGAIFFDLFALPSEKYSFIPTGVDMAYLPKTTNLPLNQAKRVLFIGEFMPNQSTYVFQVLAKAQQLAPTTVQGLEFVFIGRQEINQPLVTRLLQSLPDWSYPISFVDHLPQSQLYAHIQTAYACLLTPGKNRYWWTNFAKMVDYIGLNCRVIADVSAVSEVRNELQKAGLGFFLDNDDLIQDAERLVAWIASEQSAMPTAYTQRYTATSQAKAFAAIFEELLNDRQ